MAKYSCAICNRELTFFSAKTLIRDGAICFDCQYKANINDIDNPMAYTSHMIRNLYEHRVKFVDKFQESRSVGGKLIVDDTNKLFKIGGNIFKFENLLDYRHNIEVSEKVSGGLTGAILGSLFLGKYGSFAGAAMATKIKNICSSMIIEVMLQDSHIRRTFIVINNREITYGGWSYNNYIDEMKKCYNELEAISRYSSLYPSSESITNSVVNVTTTWEDEVQKYKDLLDSNSISQEEYDARKKQIINFYANKKIKK